MVAWRLSLRYSATSLRSPEWAARAAAWASCPVAPARGARAEAVFDGRDVPAAGLRNGLSSSNFSTLLARDSASRSSAKSTRFDSSIQAVSTSTTPAWPKALGRESVLGDCQLALRFVPLRLGCGQIVALLLDLRLEVCELLLELLELAFSLLSAAAILDGLGHRHVL